MDKPRSLHAIKSAFESGVLLALFCVTFGCGTLGAGECQPVPEATPEQKRTTTELLAIKATTDYDRVYAAFNAFCKAHFGAEREPLVYARFGKELKEVRTGRWLYASERSAAIGFETNLPAMSHVEYGTTPDCGEKTAPPERHFYIHLHHLPKLKPEATYHYRIVTVDERGNRLVSKVDTFKTKAPDGVVRLPGELKGPPFTLDKDKTTYLLTQDIKAPGRAFNITGKDVTLDLGGHTVRYSERGIFASKITGLTVLNGRIVQSDYKEAIEADGKDHRSNNILLDGCGNVTLAGLSLDHSAPQETCVAFKKATGTCEIHHNVFLDRGTKITNRHGSGVTELLCGRKGDETTFKVHHNLVKRARQNGLRFAKELHHNEIYIDSWSTNSFATGSQNKGSEHHHNRVFGTGYNAYAFPWSKYDFHVHNNFVHMQAVDTSKRWGEKWGDINMLSGLRVTNYGKGGQDRKNLRYANNTVIIRGYGNCEIRGTEFYSDETIHDLVCEDATIVAEAQHEKTRKIACIVAQGHFKKPKSIPVVYRNCRLISNICNVRFGDAYGKGNNHHFVGCTFVRTGDRKDYHTFAFSGQYWNFGHVVRDCVFGPGTAYNDVWWQETGGKSWYRVEWTLTLKAPPGATVKIHEKREGTDKETEKTAPSLVFEGKVGADGALKIPLTQCVIKPPKKYNWRKGSLERQEISRTPHTIEVSFGGKSKTVKATMDKKQSLKVEF